MTHVGGMLRMTGNTIRQTIDIRYPVTADPEKVQAALQAAFADNPGGFNLEIIRNDPPYYHSVEEPGIKILLAVSRKYVSPDTKPYVMGGITHARFLKNAVPYGPCYAPDEIGRAPFGYAHAPDEAAEIQQLAKAIKVYFMALLRLDRELKQQMPEQGWNDPFLGGHSLDC